MRKFVTCCSISCLSDCTRRNFFLFLALSQVRQFSLRDIEKLMMYTGEVLTGSSTLKLDDLDGHFYNQTRKGIYDRGGPPVPSGSSQMI